MLAAIQTLTGLAEELPEYNLQGYDIEYLAYHFEKTHGQTRILNMDDDTVKKEIIKLIGKLGE